MRLCRVSPFLLVVFGLAVSSARAAVMTSTVRVSSGAPPYNISYILAQDISGGQGTMTVNIRRASDNAIVRSFTVTDDLALLPGPHTTDVSWDGMLTNGSPAPSGSY